MLQNQHTSLSLRRRLRSCQDMSLRTSYILHRTPQLSAELLHPSPQDNVYLPTSYEHTGNDSTHSDQQADRYVHQFLSSDQDTDPSSPCSLAYLPRSDHPAESGYLPQRPTLLRLVHSA